MKLTRDLASERSPRRPRRRASWKKSMILSLVAVAFIAGCATTATEDDNTTNTFVTVVTFTGLAAQNGGGLSAGPEIFSDVCIDPNSVGACIAFNDEGVITLFAQAKDQTSLSSTVQDIIFDRYRVTYIRADGRNVPGVDVPFPFDGVVNFRVPLETNTTATFLIVRHQAKLESPLRELQNAGGATVISTIARVDFFGRDLAGRQVQVTGFINITFGDF